MKKWKYIVKQGYFVKDSSKLFPGEAVNTCGFMRRSHVLWKNISGR
jgi:hypothetical protein